MLEALKFVQGAVARKDFVPALQHFRIRNQTIRSFNGVLGLCSPIPLDLDVAPNGVQLIRAIAACEDTAALHLNEKGRLVVRSGTFKTFVDCLSTEGFPEFEPSGRQVILTDTFLPALKYLEPFIANDASRPWACGVLFDGESAFATNNIVLQQYWMGFAFPVRVNIPAAAVRELLRIGVPPCRLQMEDNRITFHYEDRRWLSTQLFEAQWPEVTPLLESDCSPQPFPPGFFEALEKLAPFTDELGRVFLLGDRVSTQAESEHGGTSVNLPGVAETGCYNVHQLLRLREVADSFDFTAYPGSCPFFGPNARGRIAGIRI